MPPRLRNVRRAVRRTFGWLRRHQELEGDHAATKRMAVVVNPAKLSDVAHEKQWLTERCQQVGWREPLWLETTQADPGHGQARMALNQGVDVVVAYGGDGTVRAVAAELVGTLVPLGILPAGTGNLFARNMGLPLANLDQALDIAMGTQRRHIDVGEAVIDISGEDHEPQIETFLVMAGVGFDAEVMATASSELKHRVGWWAYVVTGFRLLRERRTPVTVRFDGADPIHRPVRSVVIGNCGELTGGIQLMPGAQIDDGLLDVAMVSPRGIPGWALVVISVLTRGRRLPQVQHYQGMSVEIRAERPMQVQLDGDGIGLTRVLRASVRPLSLWLCCPE